MAGSGYSIRLLSGAKSDKGMQRANNEDSIRLWGQDQAVLAVVADGMGGAVAGEEASRIAADTIRSQMLSNPYHQPTDYEHVDEKLLTVKMVESVQRANLSILAQATSKPELKGMGTTLTMAFVRSGDVILVHVGDSRAYLVDGLDHSVNQLTRDHSFVQALLDAGHIRPEEAEHHAMKNVLYRALGQQGELDVELITGVNLNSGDRIILCSDGLTLHVRAHEIGTLALATDDPHEIAASLVDLANQRGGRDNISVIAIVAQGMNATDDSTRLPPLDYEDDDPTLPLR